MTEIACREIVEAIASGIWTLDQDNITTLVNPAMAQMLGHTSAAMQGTSLFDYVEPIAIIQARRELQKCREGERVRLELPLRRRDGEVAWSLLSASPLPDAGSGYAGALAIVTELSELTEMKRRLTFLSEHDPLTGLFNRRHFISELDRQLTYAARSRRAGAVLTLDLDNFKTFNDLYGHQSGDAVLIAVADVLKLRLGRTDIAARLGSNDFAVVLPEATHLQALGCAQHIRAQLRDQSRESTITASIGVAFFTGAEQITASEVLVRADTARYQAAQLGGDRIQFYVQQAPTLTELQRVREALLEDRFILFGQPIVDLRTGSTTHHELLVRMLSKEGEVIFPDSFLPVAERFGLIGAIDRWVTQAALVLAADGKTVSVNLSSSSIGDSEIVAAVRRALKGGLDPGSLIFEVSETGALMNIDALGEFADTLHRLGCVLALDDFGAGFGSFSYLKYLPAQLLKIDPDFVRDLVGNRADHEVVKSIVSIARSLDKVTIAKGVEDAETLALLRCYGVDQAQGFHLGRPERISPPTAAERSLNRMIGSALDQPGIEPAPRHQRRQRQAEPDTIRPRVLLAEDNEVNQLAALRLLERCGYDVDVVETGRRAIELGRHGTYTAILMDCQLPELDGYQATSAIRRLEDYARRTPIIALTANANAGNEEKCLAAGMDAYIAKPLRWEALRETLARFVENGSERRYPPESDGGEPSGLIDPSILIELGDREPGIDDDIVSLFFAETRRQLERLAHAVADGRAREIYDIASRIKGGCANVGATRMVAICDQLAEVAASDSKTELTDLGSELGNVFALTESAFKRELNVRSASGS